MWQLKPLMNMHKVSIGLPATCCSSLASSLCPEPWYCYRYKCRLGAKDWSALGLAGAITSLAAASALQAVDGIALKAMVDNWAAAPETEKAALYQAALAVRQIEIGLASISSILTGLSFIAFGAGFVREPRLANWMGGVAILGGILTFISGIVIAYTGFSPLSMLINMPSSILLVVWLSAIGIKAWNDALFIPVRTLI